MNLNLLQHPILAPEGPIQDLTGHAQGARSNPVRGLLRDLTGLAPGSERAPFGARTGWKPHGLPLAGKAPLCPCGAPYQSCMGLGRGHYLG